MDLQLITENIRTRLNIDQLNGIQRKMLQCDSPAIILIAPTGSGKTLAFAARMLTYLDSPSQRVQGLVLAPSRELVIQIAEIIRKIASGYKTVALYGGHSVIDEKNSLNPVPDIIVATPGRLLDHLQRGHIEIIRPEVLVIDEYDKSLELGFETEMKRITARLKSYHRLLLTSATRMDTLPPYLATQGMHPTFIEDIPAEKPSDRSDIVEVTSFAKDKLDTLVNLLGSNQEGSRSIVFVNHRESAERIYNRLKADNISAALYHGALDQEQRATAIDLLANGSVAVLVATDLAARGLDIEKLDHVIHYHLPVNEAAWTHRNGRTARVQARGTIYVITSEADSLPEYISFDRKFIPDPHSGAPVKARMASLYFSAGKKEKLSRGDIVGFLIAQAGLSADEIGLISLRDHSAIAAIAAPKLNATLQAIAGAKIKGRRIRITHLRP